MREIEKQVVDEYTFGKSYRALGRKYGVNHSTIRRMLIRNGVRVPTKTEMEYMNIANGLGNNISWEWLAQFDDIEKLKTLNRCIRPRDDCNRFTTDQYMKYIKRFYDCEQFNRIYMLWLKNDKSTLRKPSIDHIKPFSKSKDSSIENLQFLTWMENYCKSNLDQETWDDVKSNLDEYFIGV